MKQTTYRSCDLANFHLQEYLYQLIQNRALTDLPHNHDFYEIIFVLRGHAVHNVDGVTFRLEENQLMILQPKNIHYFERQSAQLEIFSLSLLPKKLEAFLSAYDFTPAYAKIYEVQNQSLRKEIRGLPTKTSVEQKNSVNTIITDFLTGIIRTDLLTDKAIPQHLQAALKEIRKPEHLSGGVEEMAKLAGCSRVHLCRLTKKYYHQTPLGLLHNIRMELAAAYLESTSFTIETIAELIGLSSVSQFHAAFKKHYRCTPNDYRKAMYPHPLL